MATCKTLPVCRMYRFFSTKQLACIYSFLHLHPENPLVNIVHFQFFWGGGRLRRIGPWWKIATDEQKGSLPRCLWSNDLDMLTAASVRPPDHVPFYLQHCGLVLWCYTIFKFMISWNKNWCFTKPRNNSTTTIHLPCKTFEKDGWAAQFVGICALTLY